jgi:hypothetical protein
VKNFASTSDCFYCFTFAWLFVSAPRQCLQQLTRILKISTPQQGITLTCQPEGGISRYAIVSDYDALGRRCIILRTPTG